MSSKIEEIDKNESWNMLLPTLLKEGRLKSQFLYQSLLSLFEIDSSSVQPQLIKIKNETFLVEETFEKAIPEEMLEYDIAVRIPPVKQWTVNVRIKSIEKATPHIWKPEEFYD
jgi:hypothetical protein